MPLVGHFIRLFEDLICREKMQSTKKLQSYRRALFEGPRRSQPSIHALNRAVRAQVDADHHLVQAIIQDSEKRAALIRGMELDPLTHSVWNDFDHSSTITELGPGDYPAWDGIGEYAKIHLLFQLALHLDGYSFTARIRPDLQLRWQAANRDPMERVRREIKKLLDRLGLQDLEYCWVMEGRARRGRGRTPLHLHGFLIASDPLVATRFKAVLEQAISVHRKGKLAAGYTLRSGDPVEIERVYDVLNGGTRGRGRWATYITKNALLGDSRIGAKRTYMSHAATQAVRELWGLIRDR